MTDDEVQALLQRGTAQRAAARASFAEAYAGATSEVAKCWAAHMVAVEADGPEDKLQWNMESLRAADAAGEDPRRRSLYPTVLANIGFSQLLMARPDAAEKWYRRAQESVNEADLSDDDRVRYAQAIDHMLSLIATSSHG